MAKRSGDVIDGLVDKQLKSDDDEPKRWSISTCPLDVARYYAKDGITDEQIENMLVSLNITSLKSLMNQVDDLHSILRKGTSAALVLNVNDALNRTDATLQEILGGNLEFDDSLIAKESLDLFVSAAVAVSQSVEIEGDRVPNFTLVMGPSGSGKTMFALSELPERLRPGAISQKTCFRVHVKASTLLGDYPDSAFDLPARLMNHVHEIVSRWLSSASVPSIDMSLFVTIDEAGRTSYKCFFDHAKKIENLVEALKSMPLYNFKRGIHVTVTGTSLETSTQDIDSSVETIKFRMQAWSTAHFHAMIEKIDRKDKSKVKTMVDHFPILQSLTTNARCAYFLAQSLPTIATNEDRWAGYVDVTVAKVAQRYIAKNGLSNLKHETLKFLVAKETFKVLNNAMEHPDIAIFPSFDVFKDEVLRSAALSLLDINLVTIKGKAQLAHDSLYPVSMTPAMAIVLAELLSEKAIITWNWRGLESIAALGEWKKVIIEMDPIEFQRSAGIIHLPFALPAGGSKHRFKLPLDVKSAVILNGMAAPYADVIAPFRLIQTKFSVKPETSAKLDFMKEINKMGITIDPEFKLKQAVTSALYVMWQQEREKSNNKRSNGKFEQGRYRENARCGHYPFQMLLSGYNSELEIVEFKVKGNQVVSSIHSMNTLEEFSEHHPVTAVFVTNLNSFELEVKGCRTVAVGKGDVDYEGVLTNMTLPDYLTQSLRKNVEIRFMFY